MSLLLEFLAVVQSNNERVRWAGKSWKKFIEGRVIYQEKMSEDKKIYFIPLQWTSISLNCFCVTYMALLNTRNYECALKKISLTVEFPTGKVSQAQVHGKL